MCKLIGGADEIKVFLGHIVHETFLPRTKTGPLSSGTELRAASHKIVQDFVLDQEENGHEHEPPQAGDGSVQCGRSSIQKTTSDPKFFPLKMNMCNDSFQPGRFLDSVGL